MKHRIYALEREGHIGVQLSNGWIVLTGEYAELEGSYEDAVNIVPAHLRDYVRIEEVAEDEHPKKRARKDDANDGQGA